MAIGRTNQWADGALHAKKTEENLFSPASQVRYKYSNGRTQNMMVLRTTEYFFFFCLCCADVYRSQFSAVSGITFHFESNLLAFVQALVAFRNDGRIVYEHILTACFIINKSLSFCCVEPFHCTVIHFQYLHYNIYINLNQQENH